MYYVLSSREGTKILQVDSIKFTHRPTKYIGLPTYLVIRLSSVYDTDNQQSRPQSSSNEIRKGAVQIPESAVCSVPCPSLIVTTVCHRRRRRRRRRRRHRRGC